VLDTYDPAHDGTWLAAHATIEIPPRSVWVLRAADDSADGAG
jgi:hypothetical protein